MRVLVTGASGFVGRHALAALSASGADCIAVSRSRPDAAGDFEWRQADLLCETGLEALLAETKPDAILHAAWYVEHGRFWAAPENLDWVGATLALARAAVRAGTRRLVGVGTCFEYDWPEQGDCVEHVTPLKATSLYGITKASTRSILEEFLALSGVGFSWARLFLLYGPGEHENRLTASVARALAAGEPARCSSGAGIRDFMDVRDAGAALAALVRSEATGDVNIATGHAISVAGLARLMGELAGRPQLIEIGALPDRPGEPPRIVADVARLTDEVGFRARYTLADGLRDVLDHWAARARTGPG